MIADERGDHPSVGRIGEDSGLGTSIAIRAGSGPYQADQSKRRAARQGRRVRLLPRHDRWSDLRGAAIERGIGVERHCGAGCHLPVP